MANPRTPDVALEVPTGLADRLRRLAVSRGQSPEALGPLVLEALQVGLHALADAERIRDEAPTEPAPGLAPAEARRLVRRDGALTTGSRMGQDRRGGQRGGRRRADQPAEAPRLVDRILSQIDAGVAPRDIAARLQGEGVLTAGGKPWTAAAIQQLVRLETDRRAHRAWTPAALDS
ncbi:MAG: hypothetical protein H6702_10360 [Myxococcales bacterium]|nr:hypothetical protein [Myxococcales bacterium]